MSNKNYQPNYKPSPFSSDSIESLQKSIHQGGGDFQTAISEVKRVADNIATALENPETPEIVKQHIKFYVHNLVGFDFADYRETVVPIYIFACRKISQIPFIPSREYIEVLTGNDKSKALKSVKEFDNEIEPDKSLFKSISKDKAQKMTHRIFEGFGDIFDDPTPAFLFAALVYAVGNETHPHHRKSLVNYIIHQAFFETLYFGNEYESFFEKALKNLGKGK